MEVQNVEERLSLKSGKNLDGVCWVGRIQTPTGDARKLHMKCEDPRNSICSGHGEAQVLLVRSTKSREHEGEEPGITLDPCFQRSNVG